MAAPASGPLLTRPASTVLIDGHNMLHRAAHGYPTPILNSKGYDVTAEFGFMTLVRAALKSVPSPSAVAVVFDGARGAEHRRSVWSGYKPFAHGTDPLEQKITPIVQMCSLAQIAFIRDDAHEADDVIAAIVRAERTKHQHYYIVSTDQDFYALVDQMTTAVNPVKKPELRNVTPDTIMTRFGISPEDWVAYKALVGDKSDGIPGIHRVGPATALKLLTAGRPVEGALREASYSETAVADWLRWCSLMAFELVDKASGYCAQITKSPTWSYDTLPRARALMEQLGTW